VFDTLVESKPKKKGLKGFFTSSFMSTVVHTTLIYGAISATMKGAEIIQEEAPDTMLIFIEEQPDEPDPVEPPPPQLATLNPPPKGFQTLTAPVEIPTEIPPVNLNERFDPRDYTGEGVEGGIALRRTTHSALGPTGGISAATARRRHRGLGDLGVRGRG
jgi:protein TonB